MADGVGRQVRPKLGSALATGFGAASVVPARMVAVARRVGARYMMFSVLDVSGLIMVTQIDMLKKLKMKCSECV